MTASPLFHRTELLVGPRALEALARTRVILFGIGGVGSWTAEALIRTGIGHLTMVDSDVICITNVNRQLEATSRNVGRPKVAELADRLQSINPAADIVARQEIYHIDNVAGFDLGAYDYVLDAIDSLANKVLLLANALQTDARVFAVMGASCKLDPTRIKVGSFWQVQGCPLAKFARKRLRKRMRNLGLERDFLCVYSDEQVAGFDVPAACGTPACFCPRRSAEDGEAHEWCSSKAQINGSLVHITATFGFFLAGLVIQDVVERTKNA